MPAQRHPGRAQPEPLGLESAGLTPSVHRDICLKGPSLLLFCFVSFSPHPFNNWFHGERQKQLCVQTHGAAFCSCDWSPSLPHPSLVSLDTIQLGTLI